MVRQVWYYRSLCSVCVHARLRCVWACVRVTLRALQVRSECERRLRTRWCAYKHHEHAVPHTAAQQCESKFAGSVATVRTGVSTRQGRTLCGMYGVSLMLSTTVPAFDPRSISTVPFIRSCAKHCNPECVTLRFVLSSLAINEHMVTVRLN